METIPQNINSDHVQKNQEECCKDVQLNEMYINDDDDDIINNPPNDASLLNESIEYNNNFKEIDNKWITQRKKKRNNTVLLQNRFAPLFMPPVDANDYENDVSVHEDDIFYANIHTKSQMTTIPSNRQTTNKYPEHDVVDYRTKITVPGNSDYRGDISKDGRKICILSDSICNRIKIHEFNKYLKNKKAYKICFPGCDTKSIHHYALHTLKKDKPDIVIINVGSNNMKTDKPITIAEDLISLTEVCKTHGVGKVYISGITPRHGYQTKIDELNNILEGKQVNYHYSFIKNDNIVPNEHLWRDKIHLNDAGLDKLANNFLYVLNNDSR